MVPHVPEVVHGGLLSAGVAEALLLLVFDKKSPSLDDGLVRGVADELVQVVAVPEVGYPMIART